MEDRGGGAGAPECHDRGRPSTQVHVSSIVYSVCIPVCVRVLQTHCVRMLCVGLYVCVYMCVCMSLCVCIQVCVYANVFAYMEDLAITLQFSMNCVTKAV